MKGGRGVPRHEFDMSDATIPAARPEHWSGRAGFILATVGSAVGIGSIWKFPYELGAHGGSAFPALPTRCGSHRWGTACCDSCCAMWRRRESKPRWSGAPDAGDESVPYALSALEAPAPKVAMYSMPPMIAMFFRKWVSCPFT